MSVPQPSSNYAPDGMSQALDILVHHNVRLSEIIVTDILDSDIVFWTLL
jgi:hypothetical protein